MAKSKNGCLETVNGNYLCFHNGAFFFMNSKGELINGANTGIWSLALRTWKKAEKQAIPEDLVALADTHAIQIKKWIALGRNPSEEIEKLRGVSVEVAQFNSKNNAVVTLGDIGPLAMLKGKLVA